MPPSHEPRAPPPAVGSIAGGFWARRQAVNATATLAHCHRLDGPPRLARQLRGSRDGDDRRRGRPWPGVLRLRGLQAARGHGLGGRPRPATRGSTTALARLAARDRPRPGPRRLPRHLLRHGPGSAARYSDLEVGPRAVLRRAPVQAARRPAAHRRRGRQLARGRPPRRRPGLRRRSAPDGTEASAATRRSRSALVELCRVTGERALPRPGRACSSTGAGTAPLGRHRVRPRLLPGRRAGPRGRRRRAATPCAPLYLAAGAVDVAVETGDAELLARRRAAVGADGRAAARTSPAGRARSTRTRRSATTSSCRRTAPTAETCAAIALRHAVAGGCCWPPASPRYADLIERTLYNVDRRRRPPPDGRAFFYTNTLHQRRAGRRTDRRRGQPARRVGTAAAVVRRAPAARTNVARTLASLRGYLGDRRRRRPADAPVRRRRASRRRCRTAGASPCASRPATRGTGPSRSRVAETTGRAVDPHAARPRLGAGAHASTDPTARHPVGPAAAPVTGAFAAGDAGRARPADAARFIAARPPHRRRTRLRRRRPAARDVYCVESRRPPRHLAGVVFEDLQLDATTPVGSSATDTDRPGRPGRHRRGAPHRDRRALPPGRRRRTAGDRHRHRRGRPLLPVGQPRPRTHASVESAGATGPVTTGVPRRPRRRRRGSHHRSPARRHCRRCAGRITDLPHGRHRRRPRAAGRTTERGPPGRRSPSKPFRGCCASPKNRRRHPPTVVTSSIPPPPSPHTRPATPSPSTSAPPCDRSPTPRPAACTPWPENSRPADSTLLPAQA